MPLPWEMSKSQFNVFLACIMCAFITTFTMVMTATVVKQVMSLYSASFLEGVLVAEATTISAVAFALLSADLSDRFGKKRAMVIGMAFIIISSLIAALSTNIVILLVSRVITGAGAAMVFSANISMLSDLCKDEYLPELMSFNHVATSIGGACGPIFGFFIAETLGLTALFILTIPICIIAILLFRSAENQIVCPGKVINYPLHILFIASLLSVLIGLMIEVNTSIVSIPIWIVSTIAFVYLFRRSKNKIFDLNILRNRSFALAVVIGLLFTIGVYTLDNTMSYYLQAYNKDLSFFGMLVITSAALASIIKGIKPIIQVFASPVIARLCRGMDSVKISGIGFIFLIAEVILVGTLYIITESGWVIIICIIFSALGALATSLFKPMNRSTMMTTVPKEQRNTASSLSNMIDNLGKVFGIIVMVNIIYYMGGGFTVANFDSCLIATGSMVLIFSVIGLLLCIRRWRMTVASSE